MSKNIDVKISHDVGAGFIVASMTDSEGVERMMCAMSAQLADVCPATFEVWKEAVKQMAIKIIEHCGEKIQSVREVIPHESN